MALDITDAKTQGRMDSLLDLLADTQEAFMDLVRAMPAGREFSVNDLRAQLDHYGIPEKSRAGLFLKAVRAGLISPLTVTAGGRTVPVTVDSTGGSAHRAQVKVYVRS